MNAHTSKKIQAEVDKKSGRALSAESDFFINPNEFYKDGDINGGREMADFDVEELAHEMLVCDNSIRDVQYKVEIYPLVGLEVWYGECYIS